MISRAPIAVRQWRRGRFSPDRRLRSDGTYGKNKKKLGEEKKNPKKWSLAQFTCPRTVSRVGGRADAVFGQSAERRERALFGGVHGFALAATRLMYRESGWNGGGRERIRRRKRLRSVCPSPRRGAFPTTAPTRPPPSAPIHPVVAHSRPVFRYILSTVLRRSPRHTIDGDAKRNSPTDEKHQEKTHRYYNIFGRRPGSKGPRRRIIDTYIYINMIISRHDGNTGCAPSFHGATKWSTAPVTRTKSVR